MKRRIRAKYKIPCIHRKKVIKNNCGKREWKTHSQKKPKESGQMENRENTYNEQNKTKVNVHELNRQRKEL